MVVLSAGPVTEEGLANILKSGAASTAVKDGEMTTSINARTEKVGSLLIFKASLLNLHVCTANFLGILER